jgi:prepilin-type processing-associated H-X9-DG protein
MAIIGVLIALLLPAVQAARESARTAQCKNNLHQLALGVENFVDAKKRMPRYWGDDAGVYGSWFTHLLPYMEQTSVYDQILELNGGQMGQIVVTPAQSNGPYTPPTTTCVPPTRTCLQWETSSGNETHTGVGHTYEDPPAPPRCLQWSPQTCTSTGGSGVPPTPAVRAWTGIDSVEKLFEALQCPSDPYKMETHTNALGRGVPYSVTNYLANYNAFTDGKKATAPWNPPVRKADLLDGTSQTILFGEAYSKCDGVYRLAMWGDCRYRRLPGNPSNPPPYPSQSFGINWYSNPNTYFFQHLPERSRCNNWRMQGMHPGGLNVAMADGSVRTLRPTMARQEITDPKMDAFGSGDPDPIDIATANAAGLPLASWDRLLLPRDGESVQVHEGAPN